MPLFFFISGYFSKNVDKSYRTAFETLIVPAIPFEIAYYVLHVATKADNTQAFLTPIFAYWFLFALFGCKIMLPYLIKIRWVVPITFIIALAAGFNPHINEYMTLSRLLCMLPFFMIGYYADAGIIEKAKNINGMLAICIGLLAAIAIYFALNYSVVDLGFTLRSPYEDVRGVLARGFQFIIAVPLSVALIKFTPKKETYLSTIGKRTLQIYFINFYFVTLIEMFNPLAEHQAINTLALMAASLLMSFVISTDFVTKGYDLLIGLTKKLIIKELA